MRAVAGGVVKPVALLIALGQQVVLHHLQCGSVMCKCSVVCMDIAPVYTNVRNTHCVFANIRSEPLLSEPLLTRCHFTTNRMYQQGKKSHHISSHTHGTHLSVVEVGGGGGGGRALDVRRLVIRIAEETVFHVDA